MKNRVIGRKFAILFLCLFVFLCYLCRIADVNRDNAKTEIHYVSDESAVPVHGLLYEGEEMAAEDQKQVDGLELTASEETIYETAAFIEEYPEIRDYFRYDSDMYTEDDLKAMKYVLYLELQFHNISDTTLDIPYWDYQLYAGCSYHDGQNPFMVQDLNQASAVAVQAGHSYTIQLAFILDERSFQSRKYDDLVSQKFSLQISGYPDIRHMELNHIRMVKADAQAVQVYESLTGADRSKVETLPDTKEGTLLGVGESCVVNGARISVDSYEIQDNLYHCQDYGIPADGEEGDLVKKATDEKGYPDSHYADVYAKTYYVFVTLRIRNDTPYPCQLPLSNITLHNYTGKEGSITCSEFLPADSKIIHTANSAVYTIPAYGNELFTYGTLVGDLDTDMSSARAKHGWYLDRGKKMYVSFSIMAPKGVNLTKNDPGNGIFLQIN